MANFFNLFKWLKHEENLPSQDELFQPTEGETSINADSDSDTELYVAWGSHPTNMGSYIASKN